MTVTVVAAFYAGRRTRRCTAAAAASWRLVYGVAHRRHSRGRAAPRWAGWQPRLHPPAATVSIGRTSRRAQAALLSSARSCLSSTRPLRALGRLRPPDGKIGPAEVLAAVTHFHPDASLKQVTRLCRRHATGGENAQFLGLVDQPGFHQVAADLAKLDGPTMTLVDLLDARSASASPRERTRRRSCRRCINRAA